MGSFAAGLAQGLGQGIQKAQERKIQEEYKKALIDQSKLQTKKLEADIRMAEIQQQAMGKIPQLLAEYGGMPGGVGMAATPSPAVPGYSEMFNAPVDLAATPARPPSVSPGPTAGMPQGPLANPWGARALVDYYVHTMSGTKFDPGLRKERLRAMGSPETGVWLFDQTTGTVAPAMPGTGKITYERGKGPQGEDVLYPIHTPAAPMPGYQESQPATGGRRLPSKPPALGGQGYQPEAIPMSPAPQAIPPGDMPATAKEKLVGMNSFIDQLGMLQEIGKDPNMFGTIKEQQYRASRTGIGGLPGINTLVRPDPKLATFHQVADTVHATRLFEMGGKQATAMELQTILNTLATTKDYKTFQTQIKTAIDLAKKLREEVKEGYRIPQQELLAPAESKRLGLPKPTGQEMPKTWDDYKRMMMQ